MVIKVKVSRELKDNSFETINLDIITQSQLDELVSNFLSSDFETRNKMLSYGR